MAKPIRNLLFLKMWTEGKTYAQIAEEYDLSVQRVAQIIPKKIREETRRFCLAYPYISRRIIYEQLIEEVPGISLETMEKVGDFFCIRYYRNGRSPLYNGYTKFEPLCSIVYKIWNKKLFKKLYDTIGGYSFEEVL